jgi:hypothetical protein
MSAYTIHVKSGDYEFIETTVEGTTQDAVETHFELSRAIQGTGLERDTFNAWFDGYRTTGKAGSLDEWDQMNSFQKEVINELKKSLKRVAFVQEIKGELINDKI